MICEIVRLGVVDGGNKFDSVLKGVALVCRMRHRCAIAAKRAMISSLLSTEALLRVRGRCRCKTADRNPAETAVDEKI